MNGKLYCFAYVEPGGRVTKNDPVLPHEAYTSCRKADASLTLPLDYQESKQLRSIYSRLVPAKTVEQFAKYKLKQVVFVDAHYSTDEGNFVF